MSLNLINLRTLPTNEKRQLKQVISLYFIIFPNCNTSSLLTLVNFSSEKTTTNERGFSFLLFPKHQKTQQMLSYRIRIQFPLGIGLESINITSGPAANSQSLSQEIMGNKKASYSEENVCKSKMEGDKINQVSLPLSFNYFLVMDDLNHSFAHNCLFLSSVWETYILHLERRREDGTLLLVGWLCLGRSSVLGRAKV